MDAPSFTLTKSTSMESLSTQATSCSGSGSGPGRMPKSPYPPPSNKEQPWKRFYPAFRPPNGKMVVALPVDGHDYGTGGLGGY